MQPERLAEAWEDPAALVLRVRDAEVPIRGGEGSQFPLTLSLVAPRGVYTVWQDRAVYLGRLGDAPVFAVSDSAEKSAFEGPGDERWTHPFAVVAELSEDDRQVIAVGAAVLRWHESAGFSSRDGSPTTIAQGGWARLDAEGGEHFPRTDPAVIVLIEHEGRVLLGSNALWEQGRFSLLAGFVEAGESLEQAVVREVFEEAGAKLGDVEYVTSQPWPFPRSLMLGFRARLAPGFDPAELRPDPSEISELRWFTRDEILSPDEGITLPGVLSIARWMLDRWAREETGAGLR